MADITLVCPNCETEVTVSEFADPSRMTCRRCGSPFAQPDPKTAADPETTAARVSPALPEAAEEAEEPQIDTVIAKVQHRPRKRRVTYQMTCWMAFAGLTLIALVVRFGGLLTPDALDSLKTYGPLAVLAMHLFVSARAFQDAVLDGILCLLVPGYSLFYAFWHMEDYMARAVFAAALVLSGIDTLAVIIDVAPRILPGMYNFLSEGI